MKKNYLYAFLTVSVWSTTAAISKLLLLDIPTLETLAISGFLAFLFLFIKNIKTGNIKKMKNFSLKDYSIISGLGFLGLFLYSALYYYGLTELSSQKACILNYLWPIMIVVFFLDYFKRKNHRFKSRRNAFFLFRNNNSFCRKQPFPFRKFLLGNYKLHCRGRLLRIIFGAQQKV